MGAAADAGSSVGRTGADSAIALVSGASAVSAGQAGGFRGKGVCWAATVPSNAGTPPSSAASWAAANRDCCTSKAVGCW